MDDLRNVIAKNLVDLRKENKMTQSELAIKLNYSDKAVSKWENGNALPTVDVLVSLANLYNVSLDYIVGGKLEPKQKSNVINSKRNHLIITLLSVTVVWILAMIIFVLISLLAKVNLWILFIWAIPVSSIVMIVFNALWGKSRYAFLLITILGWTLLTSFYIQFFKYNIWPVFLLGIPLQLALILWAVLEKNK